MVEKMALVDLYPFFGSMLIIMGIITAIWFIIHVERGFRFSGWKSAIAIAMLSVFFAFGIQLILISIGAAG